MHAESILLLNRGDIYKLKASFKKGQMNNTDIIAKDAVVSWLLDREQIPHRTVSELIPRDIFQRLSKRAVEKVFLLVKKLNLGWQDSSQEMQTFFDCYSWELGRDLFPLIFEHCYFQQLIDTVKPDKLIVSSDISNSFWKTKITTPRLLLSELPHLTELTTSFTRKILGNSTLRRSLLRSFLSTRGSKLPNSTKILGNGRKCILFVGIESRGELKEFLPLINSLISSNNNVAILSINDFNCSKLSFDIPQDNICFISIGKKLSENGYRLNDAEKRLLNKLSTAIHAEMEQWGSVANLDRDLEQAYLTHKIMLRILPNIYESLPISKVVVTREYSQLSRINFYFCNKEQIATLNIPISIDQLFYIRLAKLAESFFYNIYNPSLTVMASEDMAYELRKSGYQGRVISKGSLKLLNLVQERDLMTKTEHQVKSKLAHTLGIPHDARLLIFTTQEHSYSIEYVNLMIDAFVKLQQESARKNLYLLIKIHPEESKLKYLALCKGRFNDHIIFKKNISIYEAIESSEILITFHSFTSIEALAFNKPVIFLRFTDDPILTIDLEGEMITKVNKPCDLYSTLKDSLNTRRTFTNNRINHLCEISRESVKRLSECLDTLSPS